MENQNPCGLGGREHSQESSTPTASLKSCDSFLSSCNEVLADLSLQERENANEGALDADQKYLKASSLTSVKVIDGISHFQDSPEGAEGYFDTHLHSFKSKSGKVETNISHSFDIETDATIWLLPEPEDMEDGVEGSLPNYDDENNYTDAMKWSQPSPLSRLCEDRSLKFKEEFQKTMALVMNGRFKSLVSQLLKLEGIVISKEPCESWVDIVTSLAWEAALLIAADITGGEIMDPEGHVKVKCIATGLCSQSQLIKGLVFKKNVAHKHMLTKHKNPKLLLLEGILGHCPSGLSSYVSMEQEKDNNVRAIIETIETCHPNVVLVEKTVSRDVQESLLAKGISLVYDMKLHRLQRISYYTGSKIFSSDDSLVGQKLKHCGSFHIEKVVEEHNNTREGGKRPRKTLMFLEGCHKPLGCTILLKGAQSDELKNIKSLVHSAVVVAYHLILDTSFLVEQRAMFSTIHSMVVDKFPKEQLPIVDSSTLQNASPLKESSLAGTVSSLARDVPICDGSGETPACERTSCSSKMELEQSSALPGFSSDVNSYEKEIGQSKCIRNSMSDDINSYRLETPCDEVAPTVLPGHSLSSISTSLKEVIGDSFPFVSASRQSFSTNLGYKENEPNSQSLSVLPLHIPYEESTYYDIDVKDSADVVESPGSISDCSEVPVELCEADFNNEGGQMEIEDDVNTVFDAQSILYLVSSRRVSKRTICEQSHLWRIKYYKNFDVSLGRFLHDILNQTHQCSACREPCEAHVYNYVNRSGKLTLRLKELSVESRLPGEAEGKLWMWAQCSKCEPMIKNQGCTRRVVMSTAARGLSFGKFLELSFSVHSAFEGLSGCGHSLQTDYVHFYGLGPMVSMFAYSSVNIYTTCMPPPVLEFNNPIRQDSIKKEAETVLEKGMLLFTRVTDSLQNIGSEVRRSNSNPPSNLTGLVEDFSEFKDMLKQEKLDFEEKIRKIIDKNERPGQSVHELLSLNSLVQELMLQSYVWDRRLRFLRSSDFRKINTDGSHKPTLEEVQVPQQKYGIEDQKVEGRANTSRHVSDRTAAIPIDHSASNTSLPPSNCKDDHGSKPDTELEIKYDEISFREIEHSVKGFQISEHQYEGFVPEFGHLNSAINSFVDAQADDRPTMGGLNVDGTTLHECTSTACRISNDSLLRRDSCTSLGDLSLSPPTHDGSHQDHLPISEPMQMGKTIPIVEEQLGDTHSAANLHYHASKFGEASSMFGFKGLERGMSISQKSLLSNLDDSQGWVWNSFSEIHKAYKMDLQRGYSQNFEFGDSYIPECSSPANQLVTEEGNILHIPLGPDDNVVSAYEGEPTSIIACALALLHGRHEKEVGKEKNDFKRAIENAHFPDSDVSVASPYWSSNGSLDSEGIHSEDSVSSEEFYTSFFDGSALVDPMLTVENPHLEIHLGVRKPLTKQKYTVLCLYEKQFRALRRRCCPCELDYISSLSRCKNWDTEGGKSGSLFVKTLDDRFVVKQIQKTEFDSFLKYAPDYFSYTNQSLSSGSQTCLAKILGIYQVTIGQSKSGKDLKYDLVVMENLLFGRNVTRLYDLKGAQFSRHVKDADGTGKVFLDANFVEDMNISPLYIGGKSKHLLQRAVWNDSYFLTSINVMDYSLLVGVDTQRLELVFGIIDYLRQYTWDKHLETWVKASLVVPKHETPTVISPRDYKKRFRKFMDLHFTSVPDHSCPEISVGPCKVCGDRSHSFQVKNAQHTENT